MRARGFTLVEMLIVFAVFAIIGVMTARILSQVIENQALLKARAERLAEVQRAMQFVQRDLLQLSRRSVRDELGGTLPAIVIDADGLLEFTRLGWRNPLAGQRSDLQRVAYRRSGDTMLRNYWEVLDRVPDSETREQELLTGVTRLEFIAIDARGEEYPFWPQDTGAAPQPLGPQQPGMTQDPGRMLTAILMRAEVAGFGEVERLWPIPGA
jgi:general secretion pathway protein J